MITGARALELLRQGIKLPDGQVIKLSELDILRTDAAYQRDTVRSTIDKISADDHYHAGAIGVLKCAQRKGETKGNLFVLDGMNRVEALKKRRDELKAVPQYVLTLIKYDTTQAEEAKEFVLHNTCKPVTGAARFRANIVHGGQPETRIKAWVEAEGFSLDFNNPGKPSPANTKDNGIRSVHILLRCYNNCTDMMPKALQFLKALYGGASRVPFDVRVGPVVYGIALFLMDANTKDVAALAKTLRSRDLDMVGAWKDIRTKESGTTFQHDKSKLLAAWIKRVTGNQSGFWKKVA